MMNCKKCELYEKAFHARIPVFGEGKKKILIIGEAPGKNEDLKGRLWAGECGNYLKSVFKKFGISLEEDCYSINAVNCAPYDYYNEIRTPSKKEIECCREFVFSQIKKINPEAILLLGESALESIIGYYWEKDTGNTSRWRGFCIPLYDLKCWVVSTYHPSYILKNNKDLALYKTWISDIKMFLSLLNKNLPEKIEEDIILVEEKNSVLKTLEKLNKVLENKESTISVDFETTGLKPFSEGHKILTVSIAVSESKAYSLYINGDKDIYLALKKILENEKIKKVLHNMKYELLWSRELLKCEIKNIVRDTMLMSHVLDNREGITSLKFQTFVNFGIYNYEEKISKFFNLENSNSLNSLLEIENSLFLKKELMLYNAKDALYTYRLYNLQNEIIENSIFKENYKNAYELFHRGTLALLNIETNGILVDIEYIKRIKKHLELRINDLEKQIKTSSFYKEWAKIQKEPNFYSNVQLSNYLYNHLKLNPLKYTPSGNGSTDEESLKYLNIYEVDLILKIKKYQKIVKTYLDNYLEEQTNSIIHPFFHLNLVSTYRSSSSNPNLQNVPKRDLVSKYIARRSFIPREGNVFVEIDYSNLEVRISACYHKDPLMIEYINNPSSDMHKDIAEEIFMLKIDKEKESHKVLRNAAKNGFVFPQFYGDYYGNCANYIAFDWCNLPLEGQWKKTDGILLEDITLAEHLIDKGIKNFEDFREHIKEIEHKFWKKRFVKYDQWKEEWYEEYLKKGYIEMFTGFILKGHMNKKKVINYPIQGTAFHCLLWSLIEIDKFLNENNMKSKIVCEIHDSLLIDVCKDELETIKTISKEIMCKKIKENWGWIIVPLEVETEIYEKYWGK